MRPCVLARLLRWLARRSEMPDKALCNCDLPYALQTRRCAGWHGLGCRCAGLGRCTAVRASGVLRSMRASWQAFPASTAALRRAEGVASGAVAALVAFAFDPGSRWAAPFFYVVATSYGRAWPWHPVLAAATPIPLTCTPQPKKQHRSVSCDLDVETAGPPIPSGPAPSPEARRGTPAPLEPPAP